MRMNFLQCAHREQAASKNGGFSLLEVLVALVVLAFGLLGVAGMQMNALKTNHSAAQKSQATMLAYLILDAMRANRNEALAGSYTLSETCSVPGSGSSLAQNDRRYWLQQVQAALGSNACGAISCASNGDCNVTIKWDDSRAGGSTTQTFSLTSRL